MKDPPDFIGKQTYTYLKGLGVNSFQGIRLDVAGDALGVLYVDYKRREGFGIEEKRLLEYLANNAALALKRVRLLDQVNKARNAAAVVSQIVALGKDEQRGWGRLCLAQKMP